MKRVVVYPDGATVAAATAARLLTELTDTLSHQDRADIVLTGGTVGIATLREVASNPIAKAVDWSAVHVWWGDERFVAEGDPDRNEGQAQDALLAHVPIPDVNVHRMGAADLYSTPEESAAAYVAELESAGNHAFDVLLLGMGPDGHVASLFPGHPVFAAQLGAASGAGNDGQGAAGGATHGTSTPTGPSAVAVHDSPKPPPTRVSLSLAAINSAKRVWIVAAGAEKADAVARGLHGDTELPVATVSGTEQTLWLLDVEAAKLA